MASARRDMTRHALGAEPIDWQVAPQPGADVAAVGRAVNRDPHVARSAVVHVGHTSGLQAVAGGTTQTTGPGVVLGLPSGYRSLFPGEIRTLAGREAGVLVAQQAAANLHVRPGDVISVGRTGSTAARVRVDGVVDLPHANTLFQVVGAARNAQPAAPPDDVVLMPGVTWQRVFGALGRARPDLVSTQYHVQLQRAFLPTDPSAAFTSVTGAAKHLEAATSGGALVGNNIAATLDAARSDALYAQVLFILLGGPGAVLAGLLAAAVAGADRERRQWDFARLRTRGSTTRVLARLAAAEALTIATIACVVGLVLGALVGKLAFGSATLGATTADAIIWAVGAVAFGGLVVLAGVYLPARRDITTSTVLAARARVERRERPMPLRYGLDLAAIAAGAVIYWATSRGGYAVVLAPEGVATVSVSYWALAGPVLLWIGLGLLAWRLAGELVAHPRTLRRLVAPTSRKLSGLAAASISRRASHAATTIVLLGLAVAFATSTAVFTTTYRHQVAVDAVLTNGADVTLTATPPPRSTSAEMHRLASVHGVRHVEPLMHRFAYVGSDLQDLYGVDPTTIGSGAALQDAYVSGGSVAELMRTMARQPDAVLVSAETVLDFQLHPGDLLRLRLPSSSSGKPVTVPFHYAGIVKEFPTAPSDSFLVANRAYVATRTADPGVDTYLVDTNGPVRPIAARVRAAAGPGAKVTDLATSRRVVGSSLTTVNLSGLARVELIFAGALAAAAAAIVFTLDLAARRRSFAIIWAVGARSRQLGAFVWGEALATVALGLLIGVAVGAVLAIALVKVLTGVFDPPPAHLFVPFGYLAGLVLLVLLAVGIAAAAAHAVLSRPSLGAVRDL